MKVSVQLRPWLIQQPPLPLPAVLAEARQAGFEGVEIGAHYLDWNNPSAFKAELEKHHLRLSGVHVGGDIFSPSNVRRVRGEIKTVADVTASLGAPFLLYSGLLLDPQSPADLASELDAIHYAADVCAQRGLRLLYHNHWWEIENDYAYLRHYLAHADPDLVGFCLDLGWVHRAGGDPLAAVDLLGKRTCCYHLRDDTPEKLWKGLGEGSMDLLPLLRRVDSLSPQWVAIEQDDITGSVQQAVGASRRYLRHHLNW